MVLGSSGGFLGKFTQSQFWCAFFSAVKKILMWISPWSERPEALKETSFKDSLFRGRPLNIILDSIIPRSYGSRYLTVLS